MGTIKCQNCGKELSDQAVMCPGCGNPINQGKPTKEGKTSGLSIAALVLSILGCTFIIGIILAIVDLCAKDGRKKTCSIIALVISAVWIIAAIGMNGNSDNSTTEVAETQTIVEDVETENVEEVESEVLEEIEEPSETEESVPIISEEEFKASCQTFDYKTIARNPDDYIGQNYVVDVKIFQSINGKWYSSYDKYYKAYTNDEYDLWLGDFLYVIDCQDKDSEIYVNVLEDDIIRVYGTFNGMVESKNSLTGTSSDDISIDMYYCELISE